MASTSKAPAPAKKPKRFLFIDYENVADAEVWKADGSFHICIFTGTNQSKIPFTTVEKLQPLGSRLEWRHVDGHGKNALDFFIAYELALLFSKEPESECVILSKDTGFDPLLNSLKKEGKKARRIAHLSELK